MINKPGAFVVYRRSPSGPPLEGGMVVLDVDGDWSLVPEDEATTPDGYLVIDEDGDVAVDTVDTETATAFFVGDTALVVVKE